MRLMFQVLAEQILTGVTVIGRPDYRVDVIAGGRAVTRKRHRTLVVKLNHHYGALETVVKGTSRNRGAG